MPCLQVTTRGETTLGAFPSTKWGSRSSSHLVVGQQRLILTGPADPTARPAVAPGATHRVILDLSLGDWRCLPKLVYHIVVRSERAFNGVTMLSEVGIYGNGLYAFAILPAYD